MRRLFREHSNHAYERSDEEEPMDRIVDVKQLIVIKSFNMNNVMNLFEREPTKFEQRREFDPIKAYIIWDTQAHDIGNKFPIKLWRDSRV